MSPLGVPARQSTNPPVIQSQSLESAPCYLKNLPIRHSVAVAKERTCYPEDHTHTHARTRAHVRLHTSVAIPPARERRMHACYTRAERASIARGLHACGMHQSLDGAMHIRLRAQLQPDGDKSED